MSLLSQSMTGGVAIILAGGQSRRFGQDKAIFRWKGRSFIGHIKQTTRELGLPVHVLRRDKVQRCGPLGGIYTAFLRYPAPWIIFLACDMPQAPLSHLEKIRYKHLAIRKLKNISGTVTSIDSRPGFPMILSRSILPQLKQHLKGEDFSLKNLFNNLQIKHLKPVIKDMPYLRNINSPEDLRFLKEVDGNLPPEARQG